jgi:hypothetical protein
MRSRTALATIFCLLAASLLAAPAANAASAFDEVVKDYQSDGKIDPCAHSEKTLRDAANQVPNNIQQYAPDFPSALGAAITKRTQGACSGQGSSGGTGTSTTPPAATTPTTPTPGGATPPPTTTTPPSTAPTVPTTPTPPGQVDRSTSTSKSSDSGTSPWLYVAIGFAAAALLILAAVGLTRFMGWDGSRLAGARQAWGEAGYRVGGTWADFRDWARFGR